eukprot:3586799-Rhodomonas_salina.1
MQKAEKPSTVSPTLLPACYAMSAIILSRLPVPSYAMSGTVLCPTRSPVFGNSSAMPCPVLTYVGWCYQDLDRRIEMVETFVQYKPCLLYTSPSPRDRG